MCGCFFSEYSKLSANEGCLTHFVEKRLKRIKQFSVIYEFTCDFVSGYE